MNAEPQWTAANREEVDRMGIGKFLARIFLRKKGGPGKTKSRRAEDMLAEAELGRYLDRYLYARFPKADAFESIERVHDKQRQTAGIDVIFTAKDGRVFRVDEKAQLYYLNRDLPTFAFEIGSLQQGVLTVGWLCNEKLETDLYLLIWPFADRDSPRGLQMEEITKADCLLVRKKDLLKLLASRGLPVERLIADGERLRAEGRVGKVPIPGIGGIYYYVSDPLRYAEAPINVIVSRRLLRQICRRCYIVTPEKVEEK